MADNKEEKQDFPNHSGDQKAGGNVHDDPMPRDESPASKVREEDKSLAAETPGDTLPDIGEEDNAAKASAH